MLLSYIQNHYAGQFWKSPKKVTIICEKKGSFTSVSIIARAFLLPATLFAGPDSGTPRSRPVPGSQQLQIIRCDVYIQTFGTGGNSRVGLAEPERKAFYLLWILVAKSREKVTPIGKRGPLFGTCECGLNGMFESFPK